ncbi:MAG: SDR family NAD(P)-dependent oxidoreductase [Pseudomonadales bacterium]
MIDLRGHVAVVTGASKGIGKGIAAGLGEAGMTVYVTGRTSEQSSAGDLTIEATARLVDAQGGRGIPCRVDHTDDQQVEALFQRVRDESGRLDVLVNNAYQIPDPPVFSGGFWEHSVALWDTQCGVGLRGYYVTSVYAAPLMVAAGRGLIVNISSRGGREYVFSASYGVGKAGVDRMARDMAHELRPYGVAAVSLSPSKVKTEFVLEQVARGMMQLDPATAQSVMLSGRCIAALARAPDLMARSGSILTVSEVAQAYGVKDPDRE